MTLNLSSLNDFPALPKLDLSSLGSFSSENLPDETNPDLQQPKKSLQTLDLSSLDNLFPKEQQPLEKPTEEIRSKFGIRSDPFNGQPKFHNGIDLKLPLNSPVKSLGNGTVINVGDSGKKDYGKFVTIDYGGGLELTYGHLNQQKVEVGDKITSDALLGLSGNTGRSKGPHLHIKAMLNGVPVDPQKYFSIDNSNQQDSQDSQNQSQLQNNQPQTPTPALDLSSLNKPEVLDEINKDTTNLETAKDFSDQFDVVKTNTTEFTGNLWERASKRAAYQKLNKQQVLANQNGTSLGEMITNGITKPFSVPLEIKPEDSEEQLIQKGYYNAARARGIPDFDARVFALERTNNAKAQGRGILRRGFSNVQLTPEEIEQEKLKGYTTFDISDPEDIKALNEKAKTSGLDFMGQTFSPEQARRIEGFVADAENSSSAFYRGSSEGAGAGIGGIYNLLGGAIKSAQDFSPIGLATNYLGNKLTGVAANSALSGSLYNEADIWTTAANILRVSHPEEERISGERTNSWAPFAREITETILTGIKLIATSPLGPAQLPLLGYWEARRNGIVPALKGGGMGVVFQVALGGLGKIFEPVEITPSGLLDNTIFESSSPITQKIISTLGQSGAFTTALTGQGVLEGKDIKQAFIENAPFGILPFLHMGDEAGNKLLGRLVETIGKDGDTKFGGLVTNPDNPNEISFKELSKDDPLVEDFIKIGNNQTAKLSNTEFDSLKTVEEISNNQKVIDKQPVFSNGKLREDIGSQNNWTTKQTAEEVLNNFFKITSSSNKLGLSIIPYGDVLAKKAEDLGYLSAFFIEDAYHRGIKPTIDVIGNRLRESLGDFGKYLNDDLLKKAWEDGNNYWQSNIADPFFSKLKQDATEKLPNKFTIEQARNVLGVNKNEFEWTVGLEDFLKENEGKKINKQDLIDVIQRGQVKVEESVASEEASNKIRNEISRLGNINEHIRLENRGHTAGQPDIEIEKNQQRIQELINQLDSSTETKYSLKAYPSMQLELPGAENSKEVKLISVISTIKSAMGSFVRVPEHDQNGLFAWHYKEENDYPTIIGDNTKVTAGDIVLTDSPTRYPTEISRNDIKFPGQHGFPDNTVAHYRSNDRTTTDNIPVHHGEEFQSDWNQEGQEKGFKLTDTQRNERIIEIDKRISELEYINNNIEQETGQVPFNAELSNLYSEFDRLANPGLYEKGLEPNPFMGNLWKDLVLKRFLRDSVIAKDENGNYKYDGITWTTARQQLERYNKLLSSTEIRVHRVLEGKNQPDYGTKREDIYEIEAKNPQTGTFVRIPNAPTRGTLEEWEPIVGKEYVEKIKNTPFEWIEANHTQYLKGSELTFGDKGYADYDIAYKNILSKIGKRFGAGVSEKEIPVGFQESRRIIHDSQDIDEAVKNNQTILNANDNGITASKAYEALNEGAFLYTYDKYPNTEKVHFMNITPSMRNSLSKEGLPFYGLGGSEKLKSPESGIRNALVTREAFDQHRNNLVEALTEASSQIPDSNINNTFNSGLNPDAFVDFLKLNWSDAKDFFEFSKELVNRFGEVIKPHLQDLWIQVKGIGKDFKSSLDVTISDIKNAEDSPAFKARKFNEGGFIGNKMLMKNQESKNAIDKRDSVLRIISLNTSRMIKLAQESAEFGEVYNITRGAQRARNSFETSVINNLHSANKSAKDNNADIVAEALFKLNESGVTYKNQTDLIAATTTSLTPDQIEAFKSARTAENLNLDWRRETKLYSMRERANRLDDKLADPNLPLPEFIKISKQRVNLTKEMDKVFIHFEDMKNSGYISLQRQGSIIAYAEDGTGKKTYGQFETDKERDNWITEQKQNGFINFDLYDLKKPQQLRAASQNLTPGQFEDLIDSAGVSPNSPEVESLRDEIYSRFPSFGYELKRDFTPGYDRNWKFVLNSIAHQTEVYASSFYSRVAGNEATKKLTETGLRDSDFRLYQIAQKYIDDEISSPEKNAVSYVLGRARKSVYLFNLAYDINQLYLNAIAQPITQTYSYFARVEGPEGQKLKGFEPEKYFAKGVDLATQVAQFNLTGKGSVDPDFMNIYDRLKSEGVIEAEFNKSLLEIEAQKSVQGQLQKKTGGFFNLQKQEHWAGTFMRAGEKTTRTHVAAEAYLVGKEKFNLEGEKLVDFIVRAVDATQSNPTRGEAPAIVRQFGEGGKLIYQFNAFNHMWMENLVLNVKADFRNRSIAATSRHLAPLLIMGGIRGLPLSGFAAILYTGLTGEDPKKKLHQYLNNNTLERLALYGVTRSLSMSQKLTPSVPVLDTLRIGSGFKDTIFSNLESSTVPALSTFGQIIQGLDDLTGRKTKLKGLAEISPRVIKGPITAARTGGIEIGNKTLVQGKGYRTGTGETIEGKFKITPLQQFGQTFNVTPSPVSDYYEKQKVEKLKEIHRKLMKAVH